MARSFPQALEMGSGVPSLLLSGDRRVLYGNTAAELLLRKGFPLHATITGILGPLPTDEADAELTRAMDALFDGSTSSVTLRLTPFVCVILSLVNPPDHLMLHLRPDDRTTSCILMIIEARTEAQDSITLELRHLGLTQSEAMIAVSISDGLTLAEIAQNRNVSVHTVRNQVKSVLAKMGCRRQPELAARVERLHVARA